MKKKKTAVLTEKSQKMLQNNMGVIRYALRGKNISEDMLQEIYLQLCKKITRYDDSLSRISTFLHLHSNWSALDQYYKKTNKKEINTCQLHQSYDIPSDKYNPALIAEQNDEIDYINEKIETLPIVSKIVLKTYLHFQCNTQKTCRELKITRNIVTQQLDLAHTLLKEAFKNHFDL